MTLQKNVNTNKKLVVGKLELLFTYDMVLTTEIAVKLQQHLAVYEEEMTWK